MIFDIARSAFSTTPSEETLSLSIRRQEARTVGRNGWRIIEEEADWQANETAIIVVDMWNKHWSWGATERVNIMAPRMNIVLQRARQRGVQIIHAPSDTMDFYKDHPARTAILELPKAEPPQEREMPDPPQPIDASDGGSDTGETNMYGAWHRQHPAIEIDDTVRAIKHTIFTTNAFIRIMHGNPVIHLVHCFRWTTSCTRSVFAVITKSRNVVIPHIGKSTGSFSDLIGPVDAFRQVVFIFAGNDATSAANASLKIYYHSVSSHLSPPYTFSTFRRVTP